MPVVELSRAARDVLRRRAAGEGVDVTPDSLEAYRELVRAGVMYPVSGFLKDRRPLSASPRRDGCGGTNLS